MATRTRRELPAGYHPPVNRPPVTYPQTATTIVYLVAIIGCVALAIWLGQP